MTTTPTSGTPSQISIDVINHTSLLSELEELRMANTDAKRAAVYDRLSKRFRAAGLNGDQSKILIEGLLKTPAKQLEETLAIVKDIAGKQVDLQKQAAEAWMKANIRQGESVNGIISVARVVSTIAKFFGADDFAASVDEKADQLTKEAQRYYAQVPSDQFGEAAIKIAEANLLARLKLTAESGVVDATVAVAQQINNAPLVRPYDGASGGATPPSGGASPSARREITREQFKSNLASIAGVSARTAEDVTKAVFGFSSKYDQTAPNKNTIDSPTEEIAIRNLTSRQTSLTDAQRAELFRRLNIEGPIAQTASAGPR